MSRPRLLDSSIVLTGAAGNIGRHISAQVLEEGARVLMTGRNEDKLKAFVEEMVERGFDREAMVPFAADSADPEACRAAVARAVEAFGGVDVLINNAGGAGPKRPLEEIPFTEADRAAYGESETMLDSVRNLLGGPWNMARAAAPVLRAGGAIINVSTIFSRTVYYGRLPYVVPKSGLNALSLGLARELGVGGRGIRVNTVFPGPIESERINSVFKAMDELQSMESGTTSAQFKQIMTVERATNEGQMAFRYPTPDDVASTITWLSSKESAAFSGHAFEVTNGMQVPAQSRSKLVSWPDKRLVDLRDKVVLILGGRDLDEAFAFMEKHQAHGAHVVLAFRAIDSLEMARARLQGLRTPPTPLLLLNPLRRENVERSMQLVTDQYGRLDGVIVLPARRYRDYDLSTASDADVEMFLRDEIVAPVALSSAVAKLIRDWQSMKEPPAITFVTNADDGQGNRLSDVNRAAMEELIRVWRYEEEQDVRAGRRRWSCKPNQLVRFTNRESDNLAFSASWAATLTNRVRRMDSINLFVPEQIERATGKSADPVSIQRVLLGLHQGKNVVITGGSVGIGFQLGRYLAIAGARVLLAARNPKRLAEARESIVTELRRIGYPEPETRIHVLADVDVGDEASLDRLHEHSMSLFSGVDILVNNAGIAGAEEMVVDMSLEDWNRTMEANLISNYSLIRKYAPAMKVRKTGHILNVSSYFGGEKYLAVAYPNRSDYSVSKAGQRALSEILSRHLGPEIQINTLAPGPVDGQRLRGTPSSPGLFQRRGRLILENKRLNLLHAAFLEAVREGVDAKLLLERLAMNEVDKIEFGDSKGIHRTVEGIKKGKPDATSSRFLMSVGIAPKLAGRLVGGGVVGAEVGARFVDQLTGAPEPFFDSDDIEKEAGKVESGIVNRLHLKTMPTDEQVAVSTVFSLADEIVSGETFHPSGGLKFERSVTEGELMIKPGQDHLAQLAGKKVVLLGEEMKEELLSLCDAFSELSAAEVRVLTRDPDTAVEIERRAQPMEGVLLTARAVGNDIEGGLMACREEMGRIDVVVSAPFPRLPMNALTADSAMSWERVLSRDDFAGVIEDQLTHHFRVARLAALWERCQVVLVTPDTSRASTREEFALALFVKNSLHAFTVTLGVEGERLPTVPAVNQVQLTRRARTEEPGNDAEVREEMDRFVAAVLQCSLPAPSPKESRYLARIYRGNAVTV
ncbi:MAG: SDR family oxidoreductase [Myxococcota bacterium]